MAKRLLFCWSGGKDSAFALWEVLRAQQHEVVALLTTVTRDYDRVSMHGVRRSLLERQAASLNIPLEIVWIEKGASNDDYEKQMGETLLKYKKQRITQVAFGDIFLEDLRKYREDKLAGVGMKAVFPIWKRNTADLADEFVRAGFRATVSCVDTKLLDASFAGREFNARFLSDLPASVDPCGENGEFHTFVNAGPIFKEPILFTLGERVMREEMFCFCDLVPA